MQSDLILHNATVITFDRTRPKASAVAIKGNRIVGVGQLDDLDSFVGAAARLCDCEGGAIIPGFNDAHCHPFALARSMLSLDCSARSVSNIADIQARLARQAANVPKGGWIRAGKYDECELDEKRAPNRWELDAAVPDHPVFLLHRMGQTCVLNGLALQIAGNSRETAEVSGERINGRKPGSRPA